MHVTATQHHPRRLPLACVLAMLLLPSAALGEETTQTIGLSAVLKRTHLLHPDAPSVVASLPVDSNSPCSFTFGSASKTLEIELTDPNGTVYSTLGSPPVQGFDLAIFPPLNDPTATGANFIFTFDAPVAGEWTYAITETMPPAHPRAVIMTFHSRSPLRIGLVGGGAVHRVDRAVRIGLLLSDHADLLASPSINASLARLGDPGYVGPAIEFHDDGLAGDGQAGDGLHTATFEPGLPGEYALRAVVAGASAAGVPFERSATARFRVDPVRATLTRGMTEEGVDSDGDGLLDILRVGAIVTVTEPGPYNVSMALHASNGERISANTIFDGTAGTQSVPVDFPAKGIREFLAVDGPYEIRNVRVESMAAQSPGTADVVPDLGSTAAYSLEEFERPEILILGPAVVDLPDADGDGLFDGLLVTVPLDLLTKGSYSWSARLVAGNGVQVALAAGTGVLQAGPGSALLNFGGAAIGQSGLYGPFTVRNLIIFGGGKSAVADEVVSTAALSPCSFESGSQLADLNGDGVVGGDDLSLLFAAWGSSNAAADLDGNGIVDGIDLGILLSSWGTCP